MVAWCPLCPHVNQHSIGQLTLHLGNIHHMKSSAHILARIIVYTPYGKEEVFQVLKDVQGWENHLKKIKAQQNNKLNSCSKCSTKEDSSFKQKVIDQSCQTDTVKDINDASEANELEVNSQEKTSDISFWKRLVSGKDSEIYRLHQKIADLDSRATNGDNDVAELELQISKKCKEKSVLEKDFKKYRESKRALDIRADNLEKGVKELGIQLSKKCDENSQLKKH